MNLLLRSESYQAPGVPVTPPNPPQWCNRCLLAYRPLFTQVFSSEIDSLRVMDLHTVRRNNSKTERDAIILIISCSAFPFHF